MLELKCKNCGARLEKIDDTTYKCSYCNANFLVAPKNVKKEKKGKESLQNQSIKQSAKSPKQVKPITPAKSSGTSSGGCLGFFLVCILLVAFVVFGLWITDTEDNDNAESATNVTFYAYQEEFEEFTSYIFEKDYSLITQDDFNSVTELSISGHSGFLTVEYQIGDLRKSFGWNGNAHYITDGLPRFGNLTVLHINETLSDLSPYYNLTELSCYNSLDYVAEDLPHPEKLTHLANVTYDSYTNSIHRLENLQSLSIDTITNTDFSSLTKLKNLEHICLDFDGEIIYDSDALDFMAKMKSLKSVSIYAREIHDMDFVTDIKKLEKLKLSNYMGATIAPLTDKTKLKALDLENFIYISDIDIINDLTGLEVLGLNLSNVTNEIQWNKLTNLQSLSIRSFSKSNIKSQIASFANLKSITLSGSQDVDLSFLAGLTGLETVNIYEMPAATGAHVIFNLPNIETIILSDSSVSMDLGRLSTNENLKNLTISCTGINDAKQYRAEGFLQYDYDLNDYIGFVEKFPNLTSLTINRGMLTNIDFVEKLPKLAYLNVSYNTLTDISVATKCPKLRAIRCTQNALATIPEFNGYVGVYYK